MRGEPLGAGGSFGDSMMLAEEVWGSHSQVCPLGGDGGGLTGL